MRQLHTHRGRTRSGCAHAAPDRIAAALCSHSIADVILAAPTPPHAQAPPGAGKTTAVPLALLKHAPEYLAGGQRIVVSCAGSVCSCMCTRTNA